MKPIAIVKRDGRQDPFAPQRIAAALHKALCAIGEDDVALAEELAQVVTEHLERTSEHSHIALEDVQDAVNHVLQESGYYKAAIAFARYRDERERQRRTDRLSGATAAAPNLLIHDADGRYRRWDSAWLAGVLCEHYRLDERTAAKLVPVVEELLAGTAVDGGVQLTTGPLLRMAVPPNVSGAVTVGLRSSALNVGDGEGDIALPGKVELAEISGSDTFVHVETAVGELVAQLTGVHRFELGASITLYFSAARAYVFDAAGQLAVAPVWRKGS